jgi:hypothetical protein
MGDRKGQILVKLNMYKMKGLKEEKKKQVEIERLHKGMKKKDMGQLSS